MVILNASGSPANGHDRMTRGADQRRIVGVLAVSAAVGGVEHRPAEALGRLRGGELFAVDGLDDRGIGDALDGVDHREDRQHSLTAPVDCRDDPLEDRGRGERAGSVVDEDDLDVAPQRRQPLGDGLLTRAAAGDDRHEIPPVAGGFERVRQRIAFAPVRRDDDHLGDRALEDAAERVTEDAVLVDADERLRSAGRKPRSGAGCDDDDGDTWDRRDAHAITLPGVADQEARTSSRMTPACSSSVFSARASSEIRICFAFASMRFSPAERPRS